MSLEDTGWMLIQGTLVLIITTVAISIGIPLAIAWLLWQISVKIFDFLLPFFQKEEAVYHPTKQDLERMAKKIEKEKETPKIPIILPKERPQENLKIKEDNLEEPEQEEIKERLKYEEFIPKNNFYLERKLKHGQKEALFAQGYKRLKTSPNGDSGASYYWVKTRYNESKEHAFFCYLIEKELRKYTKEVDLFVNSGPDVIVRHAGKVYAFDVETGKNLIRKPEQTKEKFRRYKEEYHLSFIFVANKLLKRKYNRMGLVITRSTFRKAISFIFS